MASCSRMPYSEYMQMIRNSYSSRGREITITNPITDYPKYVFKPDDIAIVNPKLKKQMDEDYLKQYKGVFSDFRLVYRLDRGQTVIDLNADIVEAYGRALKLTNGFHVGALPPNYTLAFNGVMHPFDVNLDLDLVRSACSNAVQAFNRNQECRDSVGGELKFLKVEECMIQLFSKCSHVLYPTFDAILVSTGDVRTCQAKVVLETMHVLAFRFKPPPPPPLHAAADKHETHWFWKEDYIGVLAN